MSTTSSRFKPNDPDLYKVRGEDLWIVSDYGRCNVLCGEGVVANENRNNTNRRFSGRLSNFRGEGTVFEITNRCRPTTHPWLRDRDTALKHWQPDAIVDDRRPIISSFINFPFK
jgi:hypothetical protein